MNPIAPTWGSFANVTKNYGDAAFALTPPTGNSSGGFSFTSPDTSVATIRR
ncbi:MAG: hypothetical protein M0C28_06150 [Candidatus Moduliflexus flocculans]|nr:hypothetical protein [Candidatus Moduliflexus flocculans]